MMSAQSPSQKYGSGKRSRGQGGFTLNEALIMLAIFAMVMIIALPNWMRAQTKARANDGMRGVENAFSLARTEALRRHSPVVLDVNVAGRLFTAFEDWDPNNQDVGTNGNGTQDGAELLILSRELDNALDFVADPEGGSVLTSMTYGSDGAHAAHSGGTALFFTDIKANVFRLNVNPVTGSTRVEKWIASTSSWSPRREAWEWNY
jgi:Tfp pilus assembly protein FimT